MVQNEDAPPSTQQVLAPSPGSTTNPPHRAYVQSAGIFIYIKIVITSMDVFPFVGFLLSMKTAQLSSSDKWYLNFSH